MNYDDAISRREAISIASIATLSVNQVVTALEKLPPVNPQKPICPIHGVYCEDCSTYEKKLNKWIGAEVLDEIKNEITMLHIFNRKNVIEIIDKYKAESEESDANTN